MAPTRKYGRRLPRRSPCAIAGVANDGLNQQAGKRSRQPEDGYLVSPGAQILIDGAHIRHLQAPAELGCRGSQSSCSRSARSSFAAFAHELATRRSFFSMACVEDSWLLLWALLLKDPGPESLQRNGRDGRLPGLRASQAQSLSSFRHRLRPFREMVCSKDSRQSGILPRRNAEGKSRRAAHPSCATT